MRYHMVRMFFLTLCFLATSCSAMTATVAERCVLIDLQAEAGKELIPALDEFADNHGLIVDKSHPISPSYERREDDRLIADLVYTISMGRFGAELSLFRFDKDRSDDLLEAFDALVEETIRPAYGVTDCQEVDGYELPVVYR